MAHGKGKSRKQQRQARQLVLQRKRAARLLAKRLAEGFTAWSKTRTEGVKWDDGVETLRGLLTDFLAETLDKLPRDFLGRLAQAHVRKGPERISADFGKIATALVRSATS
jgi:hypothetical protein